MKRILIPTDFSECARNAATTAIDMAKKIGGELHFLHYMSIPVNWAQIETGHEDIHPDISRDVKEARFELAELIKLAEKQGIKAEQYLGYNESPLNIINHIKEQKIDLVVMGSHGSSGVKELFMGSNAQKVVRLSPVPVLITKLEHQLVNISDFIFVSDFEIETIHPFESFMSIAQLLEAKIHLLFINTPSFFNDTWEINSKMLQYKLMGGNLIGKVETVNSFVFEEGLEKYCGQFSNVIVAMATHGRKGISRMFYGSLAEKVVNHINFPVLSVKIAHEVDEHHPRVYA